MATPLLVVVFVAAAAVIWVSGVQLSNATDALDGRLGLGSALGGLILLALATNLPELAITITAAASGNVGLAVGNLLGGIAVQTVVLAVLDWRARGAPLTHRVGSLTVALEGSIVVAVLVAAVMTTQLPAHTNVAGLSPGTIAIALLWLAGLAVVDRTRGGLAWKLDAPARRATSDDPAPFERRSTAFVAGVFLLAALLTLGAGVAIERSGDDLAGRIGLAGPIFGATILAASTAIPEISTGLASVRLRQYELAFSDIFGGNAVLPVFFVLADLISGRPALPAAHGTDIWIAGLGVVLTAVYLIGLLLRPNRRWGPLGPDSWVVVGLYAIGIAGLTIVG